MKNKKGFTLVELLAAIVILGILSVFALPTITRMFESSRNKMYVSDAKKLISLVEYRLKASSTTIDKPDNGNIEGFLLRKILIYYPNLLNKL